MMSGGRLDCRGGRVVPAFDRATAKKLEAARNERIRRERATGKHLPVEVSYTKPAFSDVLAEIATRFGTSDTGLRKRLRSPVKFMAWSTARAILDALPADWRARMEASLFAPATIETRREYFACVVAASDALGAQHPDFHATRSGLFEEEADRFEKAIQSDADVPMGRIRLAHMQVLSRFASFPRLARLPAADMRQLLRRSYRVEQLTILQERRAYGAQYGQPEPLTEHPELFAIRLGSDQPHKVVPALDSARAVFRAEKARRARNHPVDSRRY